MRGAALSVLCGSKCATVRLRNLSLPSLFHLSFRAAVQFCYFCVAPIHNLCGSQFRFRSGSIGVKGLHPCLCSKPDRSSEEAKEVYYKTGPGKTQVASKEVR